jgi:hypothetical protein
VVVVGVVGLSGCVLGNLVCWADILMVYNPSAAIKEAGGCGLEHGQCGVLLLPSLCAW